MSEELEQIILRSPLLTIEEKEKLIDKLKLGDQEKLKEIFLNAEKSLFEELEKAGLDMSVFQEKINKFFKNKSKELERKADSEELGDIEEQINSL